MSIYRTHGSALVTSFLAKNQPQHIDSKNTII